MNLADVDSRYPTMAEVLSVDQNDVHEWVDFTFLRDDPQAFGAEAFDKFRRAASAGLGIDANGIYCLGSGAIGWSLNPDNMEGATLARFGDGSDLDLAFISEVHFESAWRDLRQAEQRWLATLASQKAEQGKLGFQRRKFFDGAILGNNVSQLRFGPRWVKALPGLRAICNEAVGRPVKVNFFIYRDYWSVHNSVTKSLYVCQAKGLLSE